MLESPGCRWALANLIKLHRSEDNKVASWINGLILATMAVLITVLTVTGLPAVSGSHLQGSSLRLHMLASGVFVVGLPVLAIGFLVQRIAQGSSSAVQQIGFWSLVVGGLVTMVTMFLCMIPVAPTDQMRQLITIHGYAGFATVPAVLLLIAGTLRWRRIQATRSATPG